MKIYSYLGLTSIFLALLVPTPVRSEERPVGVLVEGLVTLAKPDQTYTLYLPSAYSPDRKWPILFVMDPRGRSRMAAELFVGAAERFGYILVSSDNTRSDTPPGQPDPNAPALNALLHDAFNRYSVHPQRVYLTGFSGTARFSWSVGFHLFDKNMIAGVIACGGALPPGTFDQWKQVSFAYYGLAGTKDFNHRELRSLDQWLDSTDIPHRIDFFDGAHQWASPELLTEALGWMEVQAMKRGLREVDSDLVDEQFEAELAKGRDRESAGDLLGAFRLYQSVADDYRSLRDVSAPTARSERLTRLEAFEKARDEMALAVNREIGYHRTVSKQVRRIEQEEPAPKIKSLLSALEIESLQRLAEGNSVVANSAQARLENAFVEVGFYLPRKLLANNQPARAALSFEIASHIKPLPHIFYNLACARARAGQSKLALAALREALAAGFDNLELMQGDSDLESLHTEPAFGELVASLRSPS